MLTLGGALLVMLRNLRKKTGAVLQPSRSNTNGLKSQAKAATGNVVPSLKQVVQGTRSPVLHNKWKEQPRKSPGRLKQQMVDKDVNAMHKSPGRSRM